MQDEHLNLSSGENFWMRSSKAASPLPNLDCRATSPLPNLDRRTSSPPSTFTLRTPSPLLQLPDQGSATKIQTVKSQKLTPVKTPADMFPENEFESNSTPVVKPTGRISSAGNTLFSSREERFKVQGTLLNIVENGTQGLEDKNNKPIRQRPLIEELN